MHCQILAIGHKMPVWCKLACEDYLSRLGRFIKCSLIEIPAAKRHKTGEVSSYKNEEADKILQKISANSHVIALDVKGASWSTPLLSQTVSLWQQQGKALVFIIGGPDGLSERCLTRANQSWSLSALTFPHALARVVLLEQLYRGFSILNHHPYHRE
ncbi:MAG: 23S rRNA (pseudouridine(1915)-N(3))-methyltransferase RlmH [Proteobacteria bacterium]|nr:23S rRNA (pseudouridine(1915)-N(3))-methyltransferase RlmH [Pseudomonadota bacterium]